MTKNIFHEKDIFKFADFPFMIQRTVLGKDFVFHSHDFCELVIITGGKSEHLINNSESITEAGDVFVFQGGFGHGFKNPEKLELWNLMFNPGKIFPHHGDYRELPGFQALFVLHANVDLNSDFKARLKLDPVELRTAVSLLEQIKSEMLGRSTGYKSTVQSLFVQLVVFLSRAYSRNRRDDSVPDLYKIAETVAFMESNFQKPLRISGLSKRAAMSIRHFHRIFRQYYKTTPADYIIRLRANHAAGLLKNKKLRISEIASACGFYDSNYFSRVFKKYHVRSPREFRVGI